MINNPYIRHQVVTTRVNRNGIVTRTLIIKSSCSEDSPEYKGLLEDVVHFMKGRNDIDQADISGTEELSKHAPSDFARRVETAARGKAIGLVSAVA